ncbi:MAG: MMPL family transporter, partial [Candidatus Latescibacteria bacterium]|nr:MMPL family transporter [Candidatus Latescibacterota bacterium]
VDANVLIFERIREELRRGKTVRTAIEAGYERAFGTILDSNVTTLITAFVLWQFGSGPIRGFATTLSIGILVSMFTALLCTRVVFDLITTRRHVEKLSV